MLGCVLGPCGFVGGRGARGTLGGDAHRPSCIPLASGGGRRVSSQVSATDHCFHVVDSIC